MDIISVRELRSNIKLYLDKAERGERIAIKRGGIIFILRRSIEEKQA